MVQRNKVLDTEGPTPKFLYAIIKQVSLKEIDWNRVANDLKISNGHAARMRFSRFKSQMEGPSERAIKRKNAKKLAKGDLKEEKISASLEKENTVKPEPIDSGAISLSSELAPVIKSEADTQGHPPMSSPFDIYNTFRQSVSHFMSPLSQFNHIQDMGSSPFGIPSPQAPSPLPMGVASDNHSSMSMAAQMAFPGYPPFPLYQGPSLHNFQPQMPDFNSPPVITWGPMPQDSWEQETNHQPDFASSSVKIEQEQNALADNIEVDLVGTDQVSVQEIVSM
ncbi:hypothetical protein PDE_04549 [Penicillium oxalicum 114-2]|uniref:Myb-like DNA-binding domain-containing protein n=1 Tax=Penicillium oxalicum (strain 114-2 / CGMCC 5302) TaxID=933388 RepID=S7ZH34_PENO1|nr:hypothetical protein PDE_04549 [Penicillium oxalicum 114-2]